MPQSLMVVATERGTGKSVISLGLLDQFERHGARTCYFKPVGHVDDNGRTDADVLFVNKALGLTTTGDSTIVRSDQVVKAVKEGRYDEVIDEIIAAHGRLAAGRDVVICEGVDNMSAFPTLDNDINIDIARNIDASMLLVTAVRDRSTDDVIHAIVVARNQLQERGAQVIGAVINRVDPVRHGELSDVCRRALKQEGIKLYGVLPELPILSRPRMSDVVHSLDAQVLAGQDALGTRVGAVMIAAMGLENALHYLEDRCLIITPGDREEILLAAGAAFATNSVRPAGIVLTGGFEPRRKVMQIVEALVQGELPILRVEGLTYETAIAIEHIQPSFEEDQDDKALAIRQAVDEYIEVENLVKVKFEPVRRVITPRRFLRSLRDMAARQKKTIVLPEANIDRILKATGELRRLDVVDIVLLGDPDDVQRRAAQLGVTLDSGVRVVNPLTDSMVEDYVQTLLDLRKHKALPEAMARDLMTDRTYFGTMMVYKGRADGMVSGATTTTQATLRPAFEFVRTAPGFDTVSSVFFMCLPDRVLVYGDCAVNPNPTAIQLAEIALASADTAIAFGIEPRVAMLSYSTGESGKGVDVEKVRAATAIIRERNPGLFVEGPIQYDAAVDPGVARTKMPDSEVAGQATVFIFPDLNTGNNTYKAVQRSSGAIAVGPVLQGLRRPVNDLSRGATITDIVNTVMVTAIQAQSIKDPTTRDTGDAS